MKKAIIAGAVLVAGVAALRRFGPALRAWAMRECEGMFDKMPEEFPLKRMMRSVEDIRGQNQQILQVLDEERTAMADAAGR
jgi:hypothetical protein